MFFIRQGATHKVVLGPAVAVGDGFTPVTSLLLTAGNADEAEVILHDNGTVIDIKDYTWAAIGTAAGYYHLTLQSGISGTVGHMTVVIHDDSLILPLRADFTILEELVYDRDYKAAATGVDADWTNAGRLDALLDLITAAGPTKTEMDTAHGLLATEAKQDIIDTNVDQIETAVITNAAGVDIAADIIAVKAETVLIVADTNELQVDNIPGSLTTLQSDTDDLQLRVPTAAAKSALDAMMSGMVEAAVNGGSPTTTAFIADGFTEGTDDHFNGRLITFTSGALLGQQTDITDYTGSTQTFTVTALTEAPANNDTFVIH